MKTFLQTLFIGVCLSLTLFLSAHTSSPTFVDIPGAASETYTHTGTVTQTTWFRRLAKVTCETDWQVSNDIEITVTTDLEAVKVIPNSYAGTSGTSAFFGPLANVKRTYQLLIHKDQLTDLVGKALSAFTIRLPVFATDAWPASEISFNNYDIYLSPSVAPADRSLTFADNVAGSQIQVRSGSLIINQNAFTSGSNPNDWGADIGFSTTYTYSGGHLLLEIRHSGSTGTNRSVDAIGTDIPGYGTQFSACWEDNYTGTSGRQGNFSVIRFKATGCPASPIPTMGEWGLIILSLFMMIGALLYIRQRNHVLSLKFKV